MDSKIKKEIHFLKVYAVASSVLLIALIFIGAKSFTSRQKYEVIDVERINIVEKDGTLRLAISNLDRSPGVVIDGKYFKSREGKRPGMIFFNDNGDECGGMTWQSHEEDGDISAGSGLMFDQYNQDQTVGIRYSQRNEKRTSGLMVWERPILDQEGLDFLKKLSDIELMPDSPEKTAALKDFREQALKRGISGALRIFVGRDTENEAAVKINDTNGKTRIILSVDGSNEPSLEFLDEEGNVFYRIPEK